MKEQLVKRNNRQVVAWLLVGVAMIIIQVLLGGITRLTESGLSITEWKPITGALPPLNDAAWQLEFEKYRTTDQFKYVHQNFSLSDFKYIFFWEWFHRLWARLMGMVFLVGFIYFLVRKKLNRQMILPLSVLFVLGALQGAVGWLMVKSGLVPEKYFVGHIELTAHFISALILLSYTLWFAFSLMPAFEKKVYDSRLRNFLIFILAVLFVQLAYGGFMAGLRAAVSAPTWPDINGKMIPSGIGELSPPLRNLVDNKMGIHFIHRGLAYLLLVLVLVFYFRSGNIRENNTFKWIRALVAVLIILQVVLGIFALLHATDTSRFIWLGVSHQFSAMLLVMCMIALIFIVRKVKLVSIRAANA
jgi:cytochrome c oxidase assembly protein subunit 15